MSDEKKPRRVGAYAKLLANYASDDAIIAAGEAAELLFVRGLAFLATADSDGYITDAQVTRYVGAGMRDAPKRARRLAEVGVWERIEGGYYVRSWLKMHESAAEKGRKRKADRDRKAAKQPELPMDSGAIPRGIRTEGAPDSLSLIHDSAEQGSDTTPQDEVQLGGDRPVTLPAPTATRSRCARHPNGNPTGEDCGGCAREREHTETDRARAETAARRQREREQSRAVLDDLAAMRANAVPRPKETA